jgi:prophage antirepressor-like protein/uncharacterized protein YkuJ
MNPLTIHFEGSTLTQLEIDGRPAWIAQEVGKALGYTEPRRFRDSIRTRWSEEFIEGVDVALLDGARLDTLRRLSTNPVLSHTRALLVLFESGLHLALVKTPMEAGRRLRRFLVTEVLPKLARQQGVLADDLALQREERLAERQDAQLAKWAFEQRKTKAEALRQAVVARHEAGELDRIELAAWLVFIAELVNGSDLPRLRGPIPREWSTPTQIGLRLGVTAHRVGRVITRLGLRTTHNGWARPRIFERNGKPLTAWLYSEEAEALIAAELASEGER